MMNVKLIASRVFSPRALSILLVVGLTIPLVVFPDRYVSSVFGGMELYALKVLPALFPFFFFSKILSELNFGYDLGNLLKRPVRFLFRSPPVSGYILVMSMLCGYPIGAKLLADYYERGQLDERQVKRIMSFTSTSGPLFIVGTVGTAMMGDKNAGFVMLGCHYLSAILNGLIFCRLGEKRESACALNVPPVDYGSLLGKSMTSALSSVAAVGGYVAVFNMVADLVYDVGAVGLLARLLTRIGIDLRLGEGIFIGLVEVTKGCLTLSTGGYPVAVIAPVCTLVLTFGGLSVTLQSLTYLTRCHVSVGYYFLTKSTQAAIAFGLCKLCYLLFV